MKLYAVQGYITVRDAKGNFLKKAPTAEQLLARLKLDSDTLVVFKNKKDAIKVALDTDKAGKDQFPIFEIDVSGKTEKAVFDLDNGKKIAALEVPVKNITVLKASLDHVNKAFKDVDLTEAAKKAKAKQLAEAAAKAKKGKGKNKVEESEEELSSESEEEISAKASADESEKEEESAKASADEPEKEEESAKASADESEEEEEVDQQKAKKAKEDKKEEEKTSLATKAGLFAGATGIVGLALSYSGLGVVFANAVGLATPAAGLALTVGVPAIVSLAIVASVSTIAYVGSALVASYNRTQKQRYEDSLKSEISTVESLEKQLDAAKDKSFIANLHKMLDKAPAKKFDDKEMELAKGQPKNDKLLVAQKIHKALDEVVATPADKRAAKEKEKLQEFKKLKIA